MSAQGQQKSPPSSDPVSTLQSQTAAVAADSDHHQIASLDISGSWRVRAEGWDQLANRDDLWYLGGGAFQPQTFGYTGRPSAGNQNLANVLDVSADLQVTHNFSITGYYGHAWGGSVIAAIYAKNYSGQLAYAETNLRF